LLRHQPPAGRKPGRKEKIMRMYVGKRRKDGKYPVTLSFNNGVQLKKVWTIEQVEKERAEQMARAAGLK